MDAPLCKGSKTLQVGLGGINDNQWDHYKSMFTSMTMSSIICSLYNFTSSLLLFLACTVGNSFMSNHQYIHPFLFLSCYYTPENQRFKTQTFSLYLMRCLGFVLLQYSTKSSTNIFRRCCRGHGDKSISSLGIIQSDFER